METEFVEIINRHRGIIHKVCHLYGHQKEYPEDLFQEIVLQLWKAFPTFRNESLVTTWMYRVALNTAISQFRRQVKIPESQSLSRKEFSIPDTPAFREENEHSALLEMAIRHLTKVEKAVIMLYLEDKNYREIADIMGITVSNVGVKLNRIKSKLEQIVKQNKYELG
jgi:RNA polymerase sigma factor (sigma-70 family)